MKQIAIVVMILFLLPACSPSQPAIQTAIAETQAVMPPTVVLSPTMESTRTEEPEPAEPATATAVATAESCADVNGTELLAEPWHLEGDNSSAELYQEIDPTVLQDKDTLLITYNLHGLTIREGDKKDESAIIFDQPTWFVISLANYGQNGLDGEQTVEVPLSDFIGLPDEPSGTLGGEPLDLTQPVGSLHTRFWNSNRFIIDITSICAFNS